MNIGKMNRAGEAYGEMSMPSSTLTKVGDKRWVLAVAGAEKGAAKRKQFSALKELLYLDYESDEELDMLFIGDSHVDGDQEGGFSMRLFFSAEKLQDLSAPDCNGCCSSMVFLITEKKYEETIY